MTVTGARAAGRTIGNSPAPIDVISAQELESTTRTDLFEALNATLPAWNTPVRANASDLGSMVRVGQLRGLSPNHTLVLVNGKRWHTTALFGAGGLTGQAPVDLATFPTGAIQRIEVLRDGASALYGSDAIAGVVNIITSRQAEGGEVAYRYGVNDGGEGGLHTLTARAGFGLGREGYINFALQYDDQDPTITSSPVPLDYPLFFLRDADGNPVVPGGSVWRPQIPVGASLDPREYEVDRGKWRWPINGRRKSRLRGFTASAGTPLGESLELFAFLNHAGRQAWAPQFYRPVWRDEVVRAIHPDGFQPKEEIREQSVGATLGLRGTLAADWEWEASVTNGHDAIRAYIHDSINPTFGLDSQTSFYLGKVRYEATTWNLDLRRGFEVGLAGPLELSLGAEARRESYRKWAGDPQSYTHGGAVILDGPNAGKPFSRAVGYSQALAGFSPEDAVQVERDNWAVYAGLSLNPVRRWTVELAARHEDYEDFGTASAFADSSRPQDGVAERHGGLSELGRQAVARFNDLGVLIDVSQLTPAALKQTVELSRVPVVATHSNARALVDNSRNLSDGELDLIKAKGGVVLVTPFKPYLRAPDDAWRAKIARLRAEFGLPEQFAVANEGSDALDAPTRERFHDALKQNEQPATLSDLVDHLDYIARRIGVEHVGIGSDFDHGAGVTGFDSEADAANVTAELLRRGYTREQVAAIWGGNFLRVVRAAEAPGPTRSRCCGRKARA